MRKLAVLFAALLVAGCGEESSSEGSESASENPSTPSEDVKDETEITTRLDNEKIAPLMIKSIIDPLIPKP